MDAVNKINILSSFDSCHVLDLNINIFFSLKAVTPTDGLNINPIFENLRGIKYLKRLH